MDTSISIPEIASLLDTMRHLIEEAQGRTAQAVNQEMVSLYWELGRRIVEFEQACAERAAYGEAL